MIDVLKRLAELDSTNPNVVPAKKMVKENADLAECSPMGMMGGMTPTPANISITAASGPELSGMLRDIMQLAGVHKVEPEHMGMAHDPMTLTAEPAVVAGPHASDGEVMRGVIDKMNPEMDDEEGDEEGEEEETDEAQYDNTPADPHKTEPFDSEEFAHHENQPGQGDRFDGKNPKAYADMNEATADLFAQYKKFVSEAYNPNSASATHARDMKASHKAELEKKAKAGDEGAKKRLAAMKDKEDTERNDYNDRMERESVEARRAAAE